MLTSNDRTFGLGLGFFLLTLFAQGVKGQEATLAVRQRFSVVPAYRHCSPAEVKIVSFGRQPIETILAQVTIENLSKKVITAVKLDWRVYGERDGLTVSTSSCAGSQPAPQIFLSGSTHLIEVGALGPKETSRISIDPPPIPTQATKSVFVDQAFITVGDVKSLPIQRYTVVVSISEIHYVDDTVWRSDHN